MNKRRYRKFLIGVFVLGCLFTYMYVMQWLGGQIPDVIQAVEGQKIGFHMKFSTPFTVTSKSEEVAFLGESNIPSGSVNISENADVSMQASAAGNYQVSFKAFGLFQVKTVDVKVVKPQKVKVSGQPIGIYLKTRGVLVVGTGKVTGTDGMTKEPALGKVYSGDYIISLNQIPVSNKAQLIYLIKKHGNKEIRLGLERNGEEIFVRISPLCVGEKEYKLGIWVRDDAQGIGTLTYIKQDGTYGALGHGIRDVDTGALLDSISGSVYEAQLWGINKGKNGDPGGLCGYINYDDKNLLADIRANNPYGIYGRWESTRLDQVQGEWMQTACAQEVEKGKAYIRCSLMGETRDYEIEIRQIDYNNENDKQNMVLEVTDENLLEQTNGIVQGLSGSPILQNGKIIGAVTHVFVKNSRKGYGIFIEKMLSN